MGIVLGLICALAATACSFDSRGLFDDGVADGASGDDDDDMLAADAGRRDGGPGPDVDAGEPADAAITPDASPPADDEGVLHAAFSVLPVELDGFADDWPDDGWVTFDMADAANYDPNDPGYQPSAVARFAARHDAAAIYFFIAVEDDAIFVDSTSLWDDDSVDLYLDAEADGADDGAYGLDDQWLIIRRDADSRDYPEDDVALTGTVRGIADPLGYNIEIRIGKSSLNAGVLGSELGFDLAINDDDGLGESLDYDGYGLWYAAPGPHCDDCCAGSPQAWCDASLFGRLVLD